MSTPAQTYANVMQWRRAEHAKRETIQGQEGQGEQKRRIDRGDVSEGLAVFVTQDDEEAAVAAQSHGSGTGTTSTTGTVTGQFDVNNGTAAP